MGQPMRAKRAADAKPKPDQSVVAHPAFRQVPTSLFPLTTQAAVAEYDTIARVLFERGRLTMGAHRALSSYAMQFDVITRTSAEGRPVRGAAFMQLDKARKELNLDDLDRPIAAPEGASSNKFARTGFANRR